MDTYLFKFSACLAVFWLVYVLFLERQNMHRFKRFYLLAAVTSALIIPMLTITHYIEPVVTDFEASPMFIPFESSFVEIPLEQAPFWNLETALWMLYGLGVLLFSIRFAVNLFKMYRRICNNENVAKRSFIYVLLEECRIPHSFFKYIFFNKSTYETDTIPKEVLLHEETHAKQLHSLDIIIIELLQIVFWFHPLIYVLKHHIKLNHEFLADQAVLNLGTDTKTYQNILLQFSSNTQDYQLSSAINYSSIKKRFTVMKTQTSKTKIWISSLLLLPIIAILFYSFAEKEYVEKDSIYTNLSEATQVQLDKVKTYREVTQKYNDAVKSFINDDRYIDDKNVKYLKSVADDLFKSFSNEEKTKFNIFKTRPIPYSDEQTTELFYYNEPVLKIDSEQNLWLNNKKTTLETLEEDFNSIIKFASIGVRLKTEKRESTELVEKIITALGPNLSRISFSPKEATIYDTEEKVSKYQVDNYLKIYKKYEALRTSKPHYINKSEKQQKEMDALFSELGGIYFRMSKSAKAKVKRPIAPVRPYAKITLNGKTYYKKYEDLTKEEKATLPPPPPPPTKKSKGGPNIEGIQDIYNPSFLEYILEMEQQGASFYLDEEKISAKKAKSIATNNNGKSTEMLTQKDSNGYYMVKLSSSEKNNRYARSIDLKVLNDGSYLIDGIKATKRTFTDVFNKLHQDITPEVRNKIMNIHVSSPMEVSNKETWFIYNSLQDYGFYRIVTPNQVINRTKGNTPFAIESQQKLLSKKEISDYNVWAKKIHDESTKLSDDATFYPPINEQKFIKFTDKYNRMSQRQKNQSVEFPFPGLEAKASEQQGASKKQIAEYNAWARKINTAVKKANTNKSYAYPIIKQKDAERYIHIYKNLMTNAQRKNAEPLPSIPPPPPAPKVKKGESSNIPPPPPPPTKAKQYKNGKKKTLNEIIKETPKGVESGYELLENGESHYFTVYKGEKTYYNKDGYITDKKGKVLPPPPPAPPAPESTLDFVIRMAKANAKFFNEGKPISSDNAIALIKKNNKLNINAQKTDTKNPLIYITKKPIRIGEKGKSKN